jgi:predicted nucleotidyltransferase
VNGGRVASLEAKEQQAIEALITRLREGFSGCILQTILFGSKARGDDQAESDIDILLVVNEENWPLRQEISTLAARVSLEYDVLLDPRIVGRERWERMRERRFGLYQNVAAEGILLSPTST